MTALHNRETRYGQGDDGSVNDDNRDNAANDDECDDGYDEDDDDDDDEDDDNDGNNDGDDDDDGDDDSTDDECDEDEDADCRPAVLLGLIQPICCESSNVAKSRPALTTTSEPQRCPNCQHYRWGHLRQNPSRVPA